MNRFCYPTTNLPDDRVQAILVDVDYGLLSVRRAALDLGWTPDEVQIVVWGEVRQ